MKKIAFLLLTIILFSFCATPGKMANEAIHHALIGQNEKIIYQRLGAPTRTTPATDGKKIMIYEFYSKGMFVTPNKSNITYESGVDPGGNRQGWTYTSNVNKVTNDPKYTIYQNEISDLKVYLDENGKCINVEHNLSKEQLEMFYAQFKQYIPED